MKPFKKLVRIKYLPFLLSCVFLMVFFVLMGLSKLVLVDKAAPVSEELMSKRFANNFKNKCANLLGWQDCYAAEFEELTKKYNIDLVSKTLRETEEADFKVNNCHLMAHAISRAEVAKSYPDWHPYLAKIDPNACSGGYIHGIIEALLASGSNFKLDKDGIKETCDVIKAANKSSEGACAHAIGHMVLVDNVGDIPKSIAVCSTTEEQIHYGCYIGVFMEDIMRLTLASHGIAKEVEPNWENAKAMELKCNQYDGEMQQACWREMAHFYTVINSFDPVKIYESCRRGKEGDLIRTCYDHAILLIMLSTEFKDENRSKVCNEKRNGEMGYRNCLTQVVLAYLQSSVNYVPKVVDFCKNLLGGPELCCSILNTKLETQKKEKVQCP